MTMGFVYLLCSLDDNTFKIGVTKRKIETRIKELQTGNSEQISLLNFYESDNYIKVENWLHKKHRNNKANAKNEWFELDDEYIKSFIDDCKKADDTIQYLLENNPFFD